MEDDVHKDLANHAGGKSLFTLGFIGFREGLRFRVYNIYLHGALESIDRKYIGLFESLELGFGVRGSGLGQGQELSIPSSSLTRTCNPEYCGSLKKRYREQLFKQSLYTCSLTTPKHHYKYLNSCDIVVPLKRMELNKGHI